MRKCSICKLEKEVSKFYPSTRSKDGICTHCRTCHDKMTNRWAKEHPEERKRTRNSAMATYRKNHPEKVKKSVQKNVKKNGHIYRKRNRNYYRETKMKILTKYGGKCECCGIDDYRFLSFDHKNNDGYKHRKEGIKGGQSLFKWIIINNYPDTIRILCFNCNFGRAFYGGSEKICPHKLPK